MHTVICLGKKACDIGEIFENSDKFIVKLIDINIEGENCFCLEKQQTPEMYENNTPLMNKFFQDITDNVLFLTSGDTEVASCSLKILEQINNKNLSVIYIRPNSDFLTQKNILQDKLIFNVFQEYARSGLFKHLFLFSDSCIENILSDIAISDYDFKYNELIFNSIKNYINIKDLEPIIDNTHTPSDITRIISFGYYDLISDKETLFYNITNSEYKIYNFFINDQKLKSDKSLHKEIKEKIKFKNSNYTKNSYSIRSISAEQSFCYVVAYSKFIQE